MNKAKSRKKVIALSVAAASSVALATYTVTSMAQNNGVKDQTALNLNVDKIDKDTVKISVDNITEAIKSLQLSLEIPSGAKFASEGAIKWLVKDSEGVQKDVRISNQGKYLDILIVSDEELDRDGSKLDICEIDVAALDSILSSKSSGYQIVPRKNGNETSYTYVVTNTNKSKSGNNIVNSSDEMLKINTPPTISLKEGTINEAIISNGRIEVIEGYDFDSNFKSFVDSKDTDGEIKDITYSVETKDGTKVDKINTSVVGSYNIKIVATDDAGETAEVSAIVNVKQEKVTELPTITGVKDEHTIYAGDVFDPMEGISAKDARGNSLEVKLSGDFNLEQAGKYTLTYTATDKWGNVAEKTTILTVIKDEAPVITGVVDKTIENIEKAKETLEKLSNERAQEDVTNYVKGEILLKENNIEEAINSFNLSLEVAGNDEIKSKAIISISETYRDYADYLCNDSINKQIEVLEKAEKVLEQKNNLVTTEMLAKAYYDKAVNDDSKEFYKKSIDSFNKLLSLGYKRHYVYRNIAIIYQQQLNDYESAEEILLKMNDIYPHDVGCYTQLSLLNIEMENNKAESNRNYEKANEYYKKALKYSNGEYDSSLQQLMGLIGELKSKGWIE